MKNKKLPKISIASIGQPLLTTRGGMLHYLTDQEWNEYLNGSKTVMDLEREFYATWNIN